MQKYLERAFLQGEQLDDLILQAQRKNLSYREDKDRILHFLQDSFTFVEGENTTQNLIFNVPFVDSFEAVRLYLWPSTRLVARDGKSTATPNELVFRPTFWTCQSKWSVQYSGIDALVEAVVSFPDGKTRSYQNSAWPASQAFSFSTLPDNTDSLFFRTNSAGALVFDPCLLLDRGSTVTLRVTPLFAAQFYGYRPPADGSLQPLPLYGADEYIREYQITGVLEGYKRQ